MGKGIFIVFDGLDGSGKSEMVKLLHNHIFSKNKKYRILTTREPTKGTYGKEIRKILKEDKDAKENSEKLFDLFIDDRKEHVNEIILPFLKNSKGEDVNIVICDRYYYSTMAFQATQGIEYKRAFEKNKNFPKPDIAFIMDLPPEISLERIKSRDLEKFEQKEFMEELRGNFLSLKQKLDDNIVIVNASLPIGKVFENIKKEIDELL